MPLRLRFRRACIGAALVLVVVFAPGASADAHVRKAFWGPTQIDGASQFPIYHDLGVNIFQKAIAWSDVAPSRPAHPRDPSDPVYHWGTDVDYAVKQAHKYHMRVLLMLIYTPPWANGGRSGEYAPKHASDFADFAYAASRRYPSVHLWMIWGEPSRRHNFKPLHEPKSSTTLHLTPREAEAPHRYARILDASYGALKKRSTRNQVIGGNTYTAGDIRPLQWAANLRLPNGRRPRLDIYGHNPFCGRRPDLRNPASPDGFQDFSDLGRFGKAVNRYWGRRVPLFLSEFALTTEPNDSEFSYYVSRKQQASWIRSSFKVARAVGAYGFGWIHLYDDAPRPDGGPISHSGLLDYQGHEKPGYKAFKGE
jgi:hypothetical protein